ncbi:MAG TPA: AI-2E family transporter [Candidatus Paceibacterota bacterium]|nr:AI-2E family transporter [Candidatus Paceibacterota bacterium]HRZ34175.1 AI-2E family transporter [Candidatus Paceibacterota bacterium]
MEKNEQPINVTISTATIFRFIFVILLFWFLFVIRDLILVLLGSIVIASAVEPGTRWLERKRIPRPLAVLLIYFCVILIFAALFYFFVPVLIQDVNDVLVSLPDYLNSLVSSAGRFTGFGDFPEINNFLASLSGGQMGTLISRIASGLSGATIGLISAASTVFGGILSFLLILVMSFYLAVQEDGVANFLRIVVPSNHEKYVTDLWKRSQKKIGLWMQGQLMLGVLIGVLTYLGLSVLGIENALFLALVAAVFELIPIFGPILAAIPAVLFAVAQGGITAGLLVTGLYLIVQQFESQLIHPLVVKKIVGIPALIAIIALIIGAQVAGFLGIILAVPAAAAVMEYISDLEKKKAAETRG